MRYLQYRRTKYGWLCTRGQYIGYGETQQAAYFDLLQTEVYYAYELD